MYRWSVILFCFAISSCFGNDKILIGIAGGTGSGKSTLAEKIQEIFSDSCTLISQDSYYKDLSHLPIEERELTNFDHPDALDFTMFAQHLKDIKNNIPIEQPIYSFHTHSREKETKKIQPAQVVIVEGILLFSIPELRDLFDLKIYVDTDDDIRILRRIDRDIKERSRTLSQVIEQYITTVKPMHDAFVAPSKQYADVIFPKGGLNQIALDIIVAKLNEDLEKFSRKSHLAKR